MKNIYLLLLIAIILTSCKEKKTVSVAGILATNDIVKIKAKKTALDTKQQELAVALKKINDKLDSLNEHKNIPLITAFKVKETIFNHFIELQGNVQTKQNILIYPEMSGILKKVPVKEGQKVRKGQILAKIDDGGMSQQLAQLNANAQLAKTTYQRQKRLWDQKIGSEIQFLQTQTSYESQKKCGKSIEKSVRKSYN